MNNFNSEILKGLRSAYKRLFLSNKDDPGFDFTGQAASDLINRYLTSEQPCMICRFGSVELDTVLRHVDLHAPGNTARKILKYITSETGRFWWDERIIHKMQKNAGFFPADVEAVEKFCRIMLDDIKRIDILAAWRVEDTRLISHSPDAIIINLHDLEPWRHNIPWSRALAEKKVLIIHPFSETIKRQYTRHHLLFSDRDVLPDFDLLTLRAVQSIGGADVHYATWFDAMDDMCNRVSAIDFDIAIIGAGAYGLPLAAFVKSIGKKAVHMGGATQLLFGIKGKRWDDSGLYNEHWIRPSEDERPDNFMSVEKGCYW